MTPRGSPSRPAPGLPFRFVGGDPSLDFVNTVDWTARGPERERLGDYDRLTRWATGAGVLSKPEAERLRRLAVARPGPAADACRRALRLRAVLSRLYRAVAAGERAPAAWEEFNRELAAAVRRLRLAPPAAASRRSAVPAAWVWKADADDLAAPLAPLVWSAAELLASDEGPRIRVCSGPECGWVYVDRSRNRLRRWCEMETCGTREKSRRRAERQARRPHRPRRPAR